MPSCVPATMPLFLLEDEEFETRCDEDGTATRAYGRHFQRRDRHVVLPIERAWDGTGQVCWWDVGGGDVEVLAACRINDEQVDIRERPAARVAWAVSFGVLISVTWVHLATLNGLRDNGLLD